MAFDVVSRFLFPAPPSSYTPESFPGQLICVPRSLNPQTSQAEDCVPMLFLRNPIAHYIVLFFHSNFEDLGRCHQFCCRIRDRMHVHVLAVEYPGYGICPRQRCDERAAKESALTSLRFAREVLRWPLDKIIVMGRSIGTGPAVALAGDHAVGGLLLVSPLLSVREVCRDALGAVADLISERFPNQELMPRVRCPCLIIHGKKDKIIPPRHGELLHMAATGASRKRLVAPENLDHNANLMLDREYLVGPALDFFFLPLGENVGLDKVVETQIPRWAFDFRVGKGEDVSPHGKASELRMSLSFSPFAVCGGTSCGTCGNCSHQRADAVNGEVDPGSPVRRAPPVRACASCPGVVAADEHQVPRSVPALPAAAWSRPEESAIPALGSVDSGDGEISNQGSAGDAWQDMLEEDLDSDVTGLRWRCEDMFHRETPATMMSDVVTAQGKFIFPHLEPTVPFQKGWVRM